MSILDSIKGLIAAAFTIAVLFIVVGVIGGTILQFFEEPPEITAISFENFREYRGWPVKVCLKAPLKDSLYFKMDIRTKTGMHFTGTGIIGQPSCEAEQPCYCLNTHLYLRCTTPDQAADNATLDEDLKKHALINKHVVPGNIQSIEFKISDGYGRYHDEEVVTEMIVYDL